MESRDATDDQITVDAANAIKKYGVGVKCATITPDEAARRGIRAEADVPLAQRHDPQHPVAASSSASRSSPRTCRGWCPAGAKPVIRRPSRLWRQLPARQISSSRGKGKLTIKFVGETARRSSTRVYDAPAAGIAMAMYKSRRFDPRLRPRLAELRLQRGYPVYLSTKNTILKVYDGRFKDIFQEVYEAEFEQKFKEAKITYEHRLIDDMVAANLKWSGGYVWACKNYDGDVQSDTVAQGFGSLGLMTRC